MRWTPVQREEDTVEIARLLNRQPTCLLLTQTGGLPRVGIYNFLAEANRFYLHLGRSDEQVADLERQSRCLVAVEDILSVVPSYWIDPDYGGAINNFFRYAEFECEARVVNDPAAMQPVLQRMLDRYQPERRYRELDAHSEIYRHKFAMIAVVELAVVSVRGKWNLGQGKPVAAYENIRSRLTERAIGEDVRTAEEMTRWKERGKFPFR